MHTYALVKVEFNLTGKKFSKKPYKEMNPERILPFGYVNTNPEYTGLSVK